MIVAAVVVVWRDRPDTLAALESLAAMGRPPDTVVCMAQQCSAPFLANLRTAGPPDCRVLDLRSNIGFAAAANRGIEEALRAGAEWVLLLNNDATVDPPCLQVCLAEVTQDPDVAVAGPAIRITDRPSQLWFAGGRHSYRFAFTRHRGLRGPSEHPPPSSDTDYVSGCCALVSSRAWQAIGPFREDFFLYYEDVDWCYRARRSGWRCRYIGQTLCSHALGVSSGQRGSLGLSAVTAYYLARNPMRFALDTTSLLLRVTRVVGMLAVWAPYNAVRLWQGRDWSAARSYLDGLIDAVRNRMGPR